MGFGVSWGLGVGSCGKTGPLCAGVNEAVCGDDSPVSGGLRSQNQQRKLSGQGGGENPRAKKSRKWGNQNLKSNKRSSTKGAKMATGFTI